MATDRSPPLLDYRADQKISLRMSPEGVFRPARTSRRSSRLHWTHRLLDLLAQSFPEEIERDPLESGSCVSRFDDADIDRLPPYTATILIYSFIPVRSI